MQKVILNLFPFIFHLFWNDKGKLVKLNFKFSFEPKSKILYATSAKAEDWTKNFYKAFYDYWTFKKNRVEVPHVQKFTDFENSIFKKLAELKIGEIITYKELARRAGYANAYRAVGKLMAKNPLPLVYPCHRVIGVKGLTGYSQGLLLKQFLLYREMGIVNFLTS